MLTVLLMDVTRLIALNLRWCGLRLHGNEIKWICIEDARFKFIVLTDNTLVIGPIGDHKELYVVHQTWHQPIETVRGRVSDMRTESGNLWPKPIIAAGEISADGRITGWESGGFGVTTPDSMKPEIEAEVRRLYLQGSLEVNAPTD